MFWTEFLRSLADRGLRGVKLVIADDHKGLRAAARRVFSAGLQRCRVHPRPVAAGRPLRGTDRAQCARWARNLPSHAAPKQRAAVAAMIRTIFAQDTKAEAFAQWDKVADALRERHGKLGALMDASREDVLAYMDYPKEHWAQIASTNPLERVNKEIKRRADVVGSKASLSTPERRGRHPPRRRLDARAIRRVGGQPALLQPGKPRQAR